MFSRQHDRSMQAAMQNGGAAITSAPQMSFLRDPRALW
jgi:hypothetical protein